MRSSAGRKLVQCRGLNGATQAESNYKQAVLATKLNAIVNKLALAGVPASQCKKIQNAIMGFWLKNQDPHLKITPHGFTVQGEYIPFFPIGLAKAAPVAVTYDFSGINPGPPQQSGGGLDLGSVFGSDFFGSLSNSNNALEPVKEGGGIGISGLASAGANALIPGIGLALNPILGGLGLDPNFSNVLKYGLNSWGASTDPEKAKQEFATGVIPEVKKYIEQIRQDPEKGLDQLQIYLDVGKAYYTVLRTEHSKANSTKAANDFFIEQFKKLQATTIDKIVSQLKSKGVIVTESVNSNPTGSFFYPTNNETFTAEKIKSDPKLPSIFKAYSLKASQALIDQVTANAQPETPTTTGTDNYQTANPGSNYAPGQVQAPGVQKAGFPWLPAIAIVGAGGSALYFANKGKGKK